MSRSKKPRSNIEEIRFPSDCVGFKGIPVSDYEVIEIPIPLSFLSSSIPTSFCTHADDDVSNFRKGDGYRWLVQKMVWLFTSIVIMFKERMKSKWTDPRTSKTHPSMVVTMEHIPGRMKKIVCIVLRLQVCKHANFFEEDDGKSNNGFHGRHNNNNNNANANRRRQMNEDPINVPVVGPAVPAAIPRPVAANGSRYEEESDLDGLPALDNLNDDRSNRMLLDSMDDAKQSDSSRSSFANGRARSQQQSAQPRQQSQQYYGHGQGEFVGIATMLKKMLNKSTFRRTFGSNKKSNNYYGKNETVFESWLKNITPIDVGQVFALYTLKSVRYDDIQNSAIDNRNNPINILTNFSVAKCRQYIKNMSNKWKIPARYYTLSNYYSHGNVGPHSPLYYSESSLVWRVPLENISKLPYARFPFIQRALMSKSDKTWRNVRANAGALMNTDGTEDSDEEDEKRREQEQLRQFMGIGDGMADSNIETGIEDIEEQMTKKLNAIEEAYNRGDISKESMVVAKEKEKQAGLRDLETFLSNDSRKVADAKREIMKYYRKIIDDHPDENKANLCRPVYQMHNNLTDFGNMIVRLIQTNSVVYRLAGHDVHFLLYDALSFDIYRHGGNMHANILTLGTAQVGKSYIHNKHMESYISYTSQDIQCMSAKSDIVDEISATRGSFQVTGLDDGSPVTVLGRSGPGRGNEDEGLALFKSSSGNNRVGCQRHTKSAEGEAKKVQFSVEFHRVRMMTSNFHKKKVTEAVASRYIIVELNRFRDLPGASMQERGSGVSNDDTLFERIKELHIERKRRNQIIHSFVEDAIRIKCLQDVDMKIASSLLGDVADAIEKYGGKKPTKRALARCESLIRQLTIRLAITKVYDDPASPLLDRPDDLLHVRLMEPVMIANAEITQYVCELTGELSNIDIAYANASLKDIFFTETDDGIQRNLRKAVASSLSVSHGYGHITGVCADGEVKRASVSDRMKHIENCIRRLESPELTIPLDSFEWLMAKVARYDIAGFDYKPRRNRKVTDDSQQIDNEKVDALATMLVQHMSARRSVSKNTVKEYLKGRTKMLMFDYYNSQPIGKGLEFRYTFMCYARDPHTDQEEYLTRVDREQSRLWTDFRRNTDGLNNKMLLDGTLKIVMDALFVLAEYNIELEDKQAEEEENKRKAAESSNRNGDGSVNIDFAQLNLNENEIREDDIVDGKDVREGELIDAQDMIRRRRFDRDAKDPALQAIKEVMGVVDLDPHEPLFYSNGAPRMKHIRGACYTEKYDCLQSVYYEEKKKDDRPAINGDYRPPAYHAAIASAVMANPLFRAKDTKNALHDVKNMFPQVADRRDELTERARSKFHCDAGDFSPALICKLFDIEPRYYRKLTLFDESKRSVYQGRIAEAAGITQTFYPGELAKDQGTVTKEALDSLDLSDEAYRQRQIKERTRRNMDESKMEECLSRFTDTNEIMSTRLPFECDELSSRTVNRIFRNDPSSYRTSRREEDHTQTGFDEEVSIPFAMQRQSLPVPARGNQPVLQRNLSNPVPAIPNSSSAYRTMRNNNSAPPNRRRMTLQERLRAGRINLRANDNGGSDGDSKEGGAVDFSNLRSSLPLSRRERSRRQMSDDDEDGDDDDDGHDYSTNFDYSSIMRRRRENSASESANSQPNKRRRKKKKKKKKKNKRRRLRRIVDIHREEDQSDSEPMQSSGSSPPSTPSGFSLPKATLSSPMRFQLNIPSPANTTAADDDYDDEEEGDLCFDDINESVMVQ